VVVFVISATLIFKFKLCSQSSILMLEKNLRGINGMASKTKYSRPKI